MPVFQPEDYHAMTHPDHPYRVGKIVYRTYPEAVMRCETVSKDVPDADLFLVHRESGTILRHYKNGVALR